MDIKAIAYGVAFCIMWSSAFTSARIIVADAPPMATLAIRFLISGLIAIAIARAMGQSWRLTPPQWRATAIFGICQNGLYLGLNFFAMQTVEASLAAIIASSLPLLVALWGWVGHNERPSALGLAGLGAGLLGVALIMGTRLGLGVDPMGVALCVVGVIALTMATISVTGATSGGNVLMIVGIQMLIGAISLALISPFVDVYVFRPSATWVLAFVYTTLVPGLAATFVWMTLVRRIGPVRAATFHFLNPFFGVATAAAILAEPLRSNDIIGVAIVMAGIFAVQRARMKRN